VPTDQTDKPAVARKFGPSGELWRLWLSVQLLMVPLFLAAVTMAVALVLVGISWFHADAWFDRRWPWISWPLTIVFDGFCAWWVVHTQVEDRRLRRDLPAKIKSQALRCPLCKGPLPVWAGVFERCPLEPFPIREDGRPEGCFRLGCDPCGRDVWFTAGLDGTVRPHSGWIWENKYQYYCPRCASDRQAKIIYGHVEMTDGLKAEIEAGTIVVGETSQTGDEPEWYCMDCKKPWRGLRLTSSGLEPESAEGRKKARKHQRTLGWGWLGGRVWGRSVRLEGHLDGDPLWDQELDH
jgi:hypothetical protein